MRPPMEDNKLTFRQKLLCEGDGEQIHAIGWEALDLTARL